MAETAIEKAEGTKLPEFKNYVIDKVAPGEFVMGKAETAKFFNDRDVDSNSLKKLHHVTEELQAGAIALCAADAAARVKATKGEDVTPTKITIFSPVDEKINITVTPKVEVPKRGLNGDKFAIVPGEFETKYGRTSMFVSKKFPSAFKKQNGPIAAVEETFRAIYEKKQVK